MSWWKTLLGLKTSYRVASDEFQITPEVARALLLDRNIHSNHVDYWESVPPRWSDFFDANRKNHSIKLYRMEEGIQGVHVVKSKVLIGFLIRDTYSNTWIIKSKDTAEAYDYLVKQGFM